jgi:TetR/AcrR family transcriptional regulator, transcriptional repressor for nem operon
MRVSRQQVLENKRTILKAAGRLFRERGFESVTVTDVMNSAGLTHGGFYGYFKSKDDLIVQAVGEALSRAEAATGNLPAFREQYLSPDHRDNLASGCPVAALALEATRQGRGARAAMTSSLGRRFELLSRTAAGADKTHKRRAAIGSWAAMVGALILARMSDDSELSDEILSETRAWLGAQDRKSKTSSRTLRQRGLR